MLLFQMHTDQSSKYWAELGVFITFGFVYRLSILPLRLNDVSVQVILYVIYLTEERSDKSLCQSKRRN